MKNIKYLRLGKPIIFYGLICSLLCVAVFFYLGADKYRIVSAACNVSLALMGALFGVALNPGNYRFSNWYDEDIIYDFIINDLNKEMSVLRAEANYIKKIHFSFDKRFILKKDSKTTTQTTNNTNSDSDIVSYEYITFLAKDAFRYQHKTKKDETSNIDLHLKLIFNSPIYKEGIDLRRKRIYIQCTFYSDFSKLNKTIVNKINDKLDNLINNNDNFKEISKLDNNDTIHFDDISTDNLPETKYSDALEFRKKNRPVQYWIEDIINPERIECSSEDFIFIVRMLTSKLNLYVKEISNTLNN